MSTTVGNCPLCGAWWMPPAEHWCPPIVATNHASVTMTDVVPSQHQPLIREMLARAWDEGQIAVNADWMRGYDANSDGEPCPPPTPNPYREPVDS